MSFKLLFVLVVGTYILFVIFSLTAAKQKGMQIVAQTKPFSTESGSVSMLVVGDSTAYGVGASVPEKSVPGLLARHIHASVENYARSGALTRAVPEQLSKAQLKEYDIILIQIGANDVIFGTSLAAADESLREVLSVAKGKSKRVVILTAGDIGSARVFPWPFSKLISYRTRLLRERFMKASTELGVVYVDIYSRPDIFSTDPDRYYTPDGLHPSDGGYAYWFAIVREYVDKEWPELARSTLVR